MRAQGRQIPTKLQHTLIRLGPRLARFADKWGSKKTWGGKGQLLSILGVVRIVMAPGPIAVEMLRAEFLRVGAMFPGMELMIGAHIAIGISGRDLIDVETLIRSVGCSQNRQASSQGKCS